MRTEQMLRRRRAEIESLKKRQARLVSPEVSEQQARDLEARIAALEDEMRDAERHVNELRDAERRAQANLERIRREKRRVTMEGLPAAEGEEPAEFYRAERVHHRMR
jgi:septation ring formation regulator EzrA